MPTPRWSGILVSALILVANSAAQEKALPRVVLVGDSIRMGYAPLVAKQLEGKAVVISAKPNGEDSGNVLRNLDEWVISERPDVVHLNAGLHDLKLTNARYQVSLADYERNLETIVQRIRKETKAQIVFATSTPIIDNLHAQRKVGFDRLEADVQKYNSVAMRVMKRNGVPINDLHALVETRGGNRIMAPDGTHYTEEGYRILAAAVTDSLARTLTQSAR
jgi:lysophospholipase L1-like esterase